MKLVFGVGINDANYEVQHKELVGYVDGKRVRKRTWVCPFYEKWVSMLRRCYSESFKEIQPTYKDCVVCTEWLTFSNFKSWMEQQDWEGKQLDKDIILIGNKIYSLETCCFVDSVTNNFVRHGRKGKYSTGTSFCGDGSNKFLAYCTNPLTSKNERIGLFLTQEDAHEAWRKRKHEFSQIVSEWQTDSRAAASLKFYFDKTCWYKDKEMLE